MQFRRSPETVEVVALHLMYVDESGDPGLVGSPTRYYALSGVVLHELAWRPIPDRVISFRRRMKARFGLRLVDEIHAAHFINSPGRLVRIRRNDRLAILRHLADEMAAMPALNVISVLVDKVGKPAGYRAFDSAWRAHMQRFENTMVHRNFNGPSNSDERAIVLPDPTDVRRLTRIIRTMHRYNPVPNQPQFGPGYRNLPIIRVIEDPSYRDSRDSYFIQMADLCAFLLYQHVTPGAYMRKKGGQKYFARLDPILCRVAAPRDPERRGIVRL